MARSLSRTIKREACSLRSKGQQSRRTRSVSRRSVLPCVVDNQKAKRRGREPNRVAPRPADSRRVGSMSDETRRTRPNRDESSHQRMQFRDDGSLARAAAQETSVGDLLVSSE